MSPELRRWLVRGAQVATGILLGWAALAKLVNLPAFAEQVHNFRVLPVATENLVAMTLPWVELVAALSLVLGVRARSGALVATSLLAVFTLGVISAVARGLDFECGCFGTADGTRVGVGKIAQNAVLLGIAGVAMLRSAPRARGAALRSRAASGAL